jgi:hypothetical protein
MNDMHRSFSSPNEPVRHPSNRVFWFWALGLTLVGLAVRIIWLFRGYLSFNSDEAVKCEFIKGLAASHGFWASPWVGDPFNVVQLKTFWLHEILYVIFQRHDSIFPILGVGCNKSLSEYFVKQAIV